MWLDVCQVPEALPEGAAHARAVQQAAPGAGYAYGATYGAHREFLEFSLEQHKELYEYGKKIGIGWATSVWDVTSAKEMIQIPCDFLKVPSACNNHFPMLTFLRDGTRATCTSPPA